MIALLDDERAMVLITVVIADCLPRAKSPHTKHADDWFNELDTANPGGFASARDANPEAGLLGTYFDVCHSRTLLEVDRCATW